MARTATRRSCSTSTPSWVPRTCRVNRACGLLRVVSACGRVVTGCGAVECRTLSAETVVIETGFAVFILFSHLAEVDAYIAAEIQGTPFQSPDEAAAFAFFGSRTAQVEILRGGQLERFLFPVPPMCQYLTETTKERLKWSLNRDSAGKKIEGLFGHTGVILDEMQHQQKLHDRLNRLPLLVWLYSRRRWWLDVAFVLAVVLNVLILGCFSEGIDGSMQCSRRLFAIEAGTRHRTCDVW